MDGAGLPARRCIWDALVVGTTWTFQGKTYRWNVVDQVTAGILLEIKCIETGDSVPVYTKLREKLALDFMLYHPDHGPSLKAIEDTQERRDLALKFLRTSPKPEVQEAVVSYYRSIKKYILAKWKSISGFSDDEFYADGWEALSGTVDEGKMPTIYEL
jgi:hypothetical protein